MSLATVGKPFKNIAGFLCAFFRIPRGLYKGKNICIYKYSESFYFNSCNIIVSYNIRFFFKGYDAQALCRNIFLKRRFLSALVRLLPSEGK